MAVQSILGRLCWGRALGVYLADGVLTYTQIGMTPEGMKVLASGTGHVAEEGLGKALAQWLGAHLTPRQRRESPVCIGLGPEQTFFTSRSVEEGQTEGITTEALLAAGLGDSLSTSEAAADHVRAKLAHQEICTIAACRRPLAAEILEGLRQAGISHSRLEPAPWSVLAVADQTAKAPRGWKVFIRVFLDRAKGLAVLAANGRPVLWRRFAVREGQEVESIASSIRQIEIHAEQSLGFKGIAGVMVQGPNASALAEPLRAQINLEIVAVEGEGASTTAYSLAMAISARKRAPDSMDLFSSIRPPPTLREVFPRKLAVVMAVVVAMMALFLWGTLSDIDSQFQAVHRRTLAAPWATGTRTLAIEKERKTLADELGAVEKFLGTRVVWSDYLLDLPTRLPPNACLMGMLGTYEMQDLMAKSVTKRVNRSLTLRAMARFADHGSAPREIDSFLESLRSVDLLKRDFPTVNLAEIKWRKEGLGEVAMFTIIALPKEKAPGGEEPAGPAKK